MRQFTRRRSRVYQTEKMRAGGTSLTDILRDIKKQEKIPAVFDRIRWPIGEAERLTQLFMQLSSRTEIIRLRDLLIHLMEWTCLFETDDEGVRGKFLEACRALIQHQKAWIRPVTALKVKPGTPEQHFNAVTRHLFLKNEDRGKAGIPAFMDRVWFSSDKRGQEMFIRIGAGEDVRTFGFPFSVLTKRMVTPFFFADPSVVLTSEHAIRWAEMQVLGRDRPQSVNKALVEAVLETRLASDFRDTLFWRNVLRFIIRQDVSPHLVPEVIDYIWYRRYEEDDQNFSLRGRTAASLLRLVEAWHTETHKPTRLPERNWAHLPDIRDTRIQFEDKRYLFQQILSTTDLAEEGRTLRHCVVSYAEDCYEGRISIWSMTEEETGKKVLTIELSIPEKIIRQVRGFGNRRATDDELAVIRKWAAAERLHIPR